tara:strand:- start:349 stop:786 length:438 start_codon:yes stop_codon:yes gene_type:complete
MAVTYKNNWKNITTALMTKIKVEMKCPVYSNFDEANKSSQFIKLIPQGSSQGDVTSFSEHRTFNISINYYFHNRKNSQFQEYIFNQISILEALIHDNPTLTLSDSTTAYNVMIGDLDLDIEPDESYEDYFVVGWLLSCEHLSNLG